MPFQPITFKSVFLRAGLALCLLMVVPAWAASKVALVMANETYAVGRLSNPGNDAREVRQALEAVGFRVQVVSNANQNQMKRALRDFGDAARDADVAFVYYSGHGAQAKGENYLIPIGAQLNKESDYDIEAVRVNSVLAQIESAGPRVAVLVLDACRDNPLAAATTKSGTKGLGRIDNVPASTMVAFATTANSVAQDDGAYARALARHLRTPGLDLVDIFRKTGAEVYRHSKGAQQPRVSELSIYEPVYLSSVVPEALRPAAVAATVIAPAPQPVANDAAAELLHGRYQILGDGSEVKDTQTGLIWARCSVGQTWQGGTCAGGAKTYTFDNAQKQAGKGWRLPTVRELHSLVWCSSGKTKVKDDPKDGGGAINSGCDGEYQRPTMRDDVFPATAPHYWSSSPYVGDAYNALGVDFSDGDVSGYGRSVTLAVRLVRAKRVALVVGNASYVHERKLKNPVNDARLLEATFKNKPLAFDQVIYLQDANRAELLKGLARFKQAAQGAELAVVYYSGHGMSNSRRSNYLLPVDMPAIASDASLDVDVALKTSAVSEDELIEAIEDAKVQLVILDACRDNGFLPKAKSGSKGLGRTAVDYTDRLLAYATEAGRTAEDGKGNNSTYAASLAKNLQRTDLSLLVALDQVAEDVTAATQGAQRPTRSGSLRTGVFIVPGVSVGVLTRDQVLFAQLSSRLARGDSQALAELEALPLYQEMRKKLGLGGALRAPEVSRGPAANGGADGKVDAQMSPDRQTIAQVVIQSQSSDATERALAEAMAIYLQDRSNRKSKLQELAEQGNDMAAMMLERTLRMGLSGPADSAGAARWKTQVEKAQSALALLEQKNNPLILSWLGNKYRDSENSADWPKAAAYFERAATLGYPYAHLVLGYLHQEGKGVAKDEVLAANWYRKSAEGGNSEGMFSFGAYLRDGRGLVKDESQAVSWFRKAAEAGSVSGMLALGSALQYGKGVAKDEAQAVSWYRKAAEAGSSAGMVNLGFLMKDGRDVARDEALAVSWFRRAAEAGNSSGMINVGFAFETGKGVARDEAQAVSWYRRAAEANDPDGMFRFGHMLRYGRGVTKDESQAVSWFRKAAEAGNTDGMNSLGSTLQYGQGVIKDEAEAFAWYQRSARSGNAEGKFSVGWMLQNGVGVAKDEAQALRWHREAAEGGSSGGMHNLGTMLADGKVVTKDEAQAVAWYRKAADLGNKKAMLSLGLAFENGEGVAKDEIQTVNWYRKAAEAGDIRGMAYFGSHLQDGRGVEKDEAVGTRWITKAAEMGDSYGMGLLGWSYDTGTGVIKDKSMAAHWYKKAAEAGNEWAKKQLESAASR